jgi:hypothetical protein
MIPDRKTLLILLQVFSILASGVVALVVVARQIGGSQVGISFSIAAGTTGIVAISTIIYLNPKSRGLFHRHRDGKNDDEPT